MGAVPAVTAASGADWTTNQVILRDSPLAVVLMKTALWLLMVVMQQLLRWQLYLQSYRRDPSWLPRWSQIMLDPQVVKKVDDGGLPLILMMEIILFQTKKKFLDLWILENLFNGVHLCQIPRKCGSCMSIYSHESTSNLVKGLAPNTKAGALEGLLAANQAIPQTAVEPPVVLPINVPLRRKPPDLAGEPCGELGRVKPVNQPDPALPLEELVVVRVDVVSEHGDQPHAGDHDPLLRIRLPAGRRGSGGRGADGGERAGGAATERGERFGGGEAETVHGGEQEGLHGGGRRSLGVLERSEKACVNCPFG
ncbi:hypothetical protein MUK42_27261 [Musa troglodytarum]|uniref:Uncharacterized protein n=1 Tax=Musa troglodytarum TaxID=320322 RepID=A0A9E7G3X6_9LILI|nr:hypothetical protein MUK42_27261 [Musa troglodytarum]